MNTHDRPQQKKSDMFPFFVLTALVIIALLIIAIVTLSKSEHKFGNAVNGVKYTSYVYRYAEEFDVDPNLVFAIIKNESNFDPDAESSVGAKGLMQIMPETFSWLQNYKYGEVTLDEDDLFEPDINIKYGCIFLEFLTQKYEVTSTVVAAYNAGFGIVDTWLNTSEYSSDGKTLSYIPYSETSVYVDRVMNSKRYYENNLTSSSQDNNNDDNEYNEYND
ncbi:MAG: lytic transglycosylase domain-containing protein [Clostridia bacterium]|nr:lytic transglycosylase domain-containing protein [Clostridia bacterium]